MFIYSDSGGCCETSENPNKGRTRKRVLLSFDKEICCMLLCFTTTWILSIIRCDGLSST